MRIIILTSDYYLAANIALKTFLSQPVLRKHKIEVAGIVSVSDVSCSMKALQKSLKLIKRSGLLFYLKVTLISLWQKIAIKFARIFIPSKQREYFGIDELAGEYGVSYLKVNDVNSKEARDFISSLGCDYLVSILLLQIVKPCVLSLPSRGAINFHPALFQKHRGTFANFWALYKHWKRSGATVHLMNEKLDDGPVIVQRRFLIKKSDTMFDISRRTAKIGGVLLAKALVKLEKRETRRVFLRRIAEFFTAPTFRHTRNFARRGGAFIKFRDFFRV